jgi:hypothetical protein
VSRPISYPVPWDQVISLTPHIRQRTRKDLSAFTAAIVARMIPAPIIDGCEHLPVSPRFLLVANHYQRKGLWILHSAAVVTQAILRHYGADMPPALPPVRWLVTANWPPIRIGSWKLPSPGDWLLPRVAHALWCYPVSFAGSNPAFTAHSIRTILRDAKTATRPIGLFPEGVAGGAGTLRPPLPGVQRLIAQLARLGVPAVPVGIGEASGRFLIRFGAAITADELSGAADAAKLCMARVAELL